MPTNFYFEKSGTAGATCALLPGWENTDDNTFLPMSTTTGGTAIGTTAYRDNSNQDQDHLIHTFVSSPVAFQTFAAQTITFQMQCEENSNASNNQFLAAGAKLISGDGGTVRGSFFAVTRDGLEMASGGTLTNRSFTITSAALTSTQGDRIVIEVGTGGDPAGGNNHNVDIRFGTIGGTLPIDDTDTSTNLIPWFRFANTIAFQTSQDATATPSLVSASVTVGTPTVLTSRSATATPSISSISVVVFAAQPVLCKKFKQNLDGYTGTEDTFIEGGTDVNTNFSTNDEIVIKSSTTEDNDFHRIGLIRYDISSIPSDSTIKRVDWNWRFDVTGNFAGTGFIYQCLQEWVNAEVTFNSYANGASWGDAGAKQDGVDIVGTWGFIGGAIGSFTFTGSEVDGDWFFLNMGDLMTTYIQNIIGTDGTVNWAIHQGSSNNANLNIASAEKAGTGPHELLLYYVQGTASNTITATPSLSSITVSVGTPTVLTSRSATASPSTISVSISIGSPTTKATGYIDYTQDANCLVAWLCNEGSGAQIFDTSGNGITGTFDASPPAWSSTSVSYGNQGTAPFQLQYVENADRVICGTGLDIVNGNPFTITFWATMSGTSQSGNGRIVAQADSTPQPVLLIYRDQGGADNSKIAFQVNGTTSLQIFSQFGYRSTDSNAHFYAISWDGSVQPSGVLFYKDGASFDTSSSNQQVGVDLRPTTNGQFVIGNRSSGTLDRGFDGLLTEIGVFDRILNDVEIADIYNYGIRGIQPAAGSQDATATPSLSSITVSVGTPTVLTSKNATASPALASITISSGAPTTILGVDKTASPSLASVSITLGSPTTLITQSALASPAVASVSVSLGTPILLISKSATATPSLQSISVTTGTPTVSTDVDVTASPSLASVSMTVGTATASTEIGVIASPSLAVLTISQGTPTTLISVSSTATPSLASVTVSVGAATASSSVGVTALPALAIISISTGSPVIGKSVLALATLLSSSVAVGSATASTSASSSSTATPSLASVSVTVGQPTAQTTTQTVALPGIGSITITAISPTVRIARSTTADCTVAVITITIPSPTATTSSGGGTISIRILLKSQITKRLYRGSLINTGEDFPSTITKRLNLESSLLDA